MRIRINPVTNRVEFIVDLKEASRGAWVFDSFLEALAAMAEEGLL